MESVDIVTEALEKAAKQHEKYKPITVDKLIELTYDLGTLLASDINDLDVKELRSNKEKYLKSLARDNTQLLFNKIWELPTENVEDAIVVNLPDQKYVLPREKRIPRPKPLTKWQKFAQEKGLKKTKKSKLTWDDVLKKWVPMHGYKRAAAEREREWLVEVPQNADPYTDVFGDKAALKKEKVAKNEFQRLRNIAVAKKVKVPRVGILPAEKLPVDQLRTAASVARVSTASIGKFQPKLPKEKKAATGSTEKALPGIRKRKPPPLRPAEEKKSNLNIIDSILNKRPKLDMEKAVNKHMFEEQRQESTEKKKKSQGKGKKRSTFGNKKGKGAGKPGSKPAGGKGKRTQMGGRKRR
ncbi:ribosome biogenesis regulatory protein homolog [Macrosteles quadrilineatus]|uniref:ribosome biogenesis regulatory protein homolog n=1 Tax=Macrosteles quadrilineatus TaxID=74068 RepID=UPI0023E18FDF|nr:ribosome biogenesis regulatory protein homolog [Macrosteles quadrilineatus]